MRNFDDLFSALARSKFRNRFRLGEPELRYLQAKGLASVIEHAREFVQHRLAPANPPHDGRQTPMRGHPVFVAQHATATCCRSCLAKWHQIDKGADLTAKEVNYVVSVLEAWFERQSLPEEADQNAAADSKKVQWPGEEQRTLF